MWKDFLNLVWGQGEGWAFIGYKVRGEWRQASYKYPQQLPLLVEELKTRNKSGDIYFCAHLCNNPRHTKENAAPSNVLWADLDEVHPDHVDPKPSVAWQTSDGRYQCLWVLDSPMDPAKVEEKTKALTYKNKADKGGWHLGKMLRLPGSLNYKYGDPQEGFLLWADGPTYSDKDLTPEQVAPPTASSIDLPDMPLDPPKSIDIIRKHGKFFTKELWDLLAADPTPADDWSRGLHKLERMLYETGLESEEVFGIVRESSWNKYARDGRPEVNLWVEILGAKDKQSVEADIGLPWRTLPEMMKSVERPAWLVEGIWTAKTVGWIAGVGKSYKSVLSIDLALSVASGKPFLGKFKVVDPGPVLMIQEEDPQWRVDHRMQVIAQHKKIAGTVVDTKALSVSTLPTMDIPIYVSTGGQFLFTDTNKTKQLERKINQVRPRLILLDPMFMLASGIDEFKAGEITQTLNLMKSWRDRYDCAVAVIHHFRKSAGDEVERLYGSMALYAWSESNLFVDRPRGGNVVHIHRDNKDFPQATPIALEIKDIDNSFDYELKDDPTKSPGKTTSKDKIVAFLRTAPKGHRLDKNLLVEATGYTDRTIRDALKEMADDGMVELEYSGVGNQMGVITLGPLYKGEGMDVGDVL